jgi:hypothetical protein
MPNILINPNSGIIEFTTGTAGVSTLDAGITGGNRAARLSYDNFGSLNLTSYVSNVTGLDRFSVDGTNGRLFSVTDNLSGSLFSVNDIAGLPIIEAFDDNTVVMGAFNRNDFVLTGNSLGLGGLPNTGTTRLYVSGNISLSGLLTTNQRPIVNGTGVLLSGEAAQVDLSSTIRTTGNQTVSGIKDFQSPPLVSGKEIYYQKNTVYFTGNSFTPDYISGRNFVYHLPNAEYRGYINMIRLRPLNRGFANFGLNYLQIVKFLYSLSLEDAGYEIAPPFGLTFYIFLTFVQWFLF